MQLQIAPSILAADFLRLEKDIRMLNAQADLIHLDVMDGTLVPNISFGFPIIDAVSTIAEIPMDVHLMIVHPEKYFERVVKSGASLVSFHLEAAQEEGSDPAALVEQIHALGAKAGIAINPDCPVEKVLPYVRLADFILVMSVFAGFGGQKFIEATHERIRAVKAEIDRIGSNCQIEVDGGVNEANAPLLAADGASMLVAGSSVFRASDPGAVITSLRGAPRA